MYSSFVNHSQKEARNFSPNVQDSLKLIFIIWINIIWFILITIMSFTDLSSTLRENHLILT